MRVIFSTYVEKYTARPQLVLIYPFVSGVLYLHHVAPGCGLRKFCVGFVNLPESTYSHILLSPETSWPFLPSNIALATFCTLSPYLQLLFDTTLLTCPQHVLAFCISRLFVSALWLMSSEWSSSLTVSSALINLPLHFSTSSLTFILFILLMFHFSSFFFSFQICWDSFFFIVSCNFYSSSSLINLNNKDGYFIIHIVQFQSAFFIGQFQSFIARGSTNDSRQKWL